VILPCYNRAWCLQRAVGSVLYQTFSDWELIVVNDGSTDGSADLLAAYGERITVLHQENRGVSAARNTGIAHARGDLVAFLDSDDYWLPQKLETQVHFFENSAKAAICQTEELWVRNGVRVNPGRRHAKPSGMIFEPSLELCLISPSAVMLRRSLLEETGFFDERLPACEDYDLWLRITRHTPVQLLQPALIVKTGGHQDQLSRHPGLDRYRIYAIVKQLAGGKLSPSQDRAARRVLARKARVYIQGCRKRNRDFEADFYQVLLELYPRPK
jgi:glycosyltransferase involved in cell wall biosynthesis